MSEQTTPHARAMEVVRGELARMEVGWFKSWALATSIRYQMGGPVPQIAIDEACEVIVWCAAQGVAAPSAYPTPLHDASSGVSLEWDVPSVWAEWVAPGVWELIADVPCEFLATTEQVCAALVAKEVSDDSAR